MDPGHGERVFAIFSADHVDQRAGNRAVADEGKFQSSIVAPVARTVG
jgi:hypothetical protein